MAGAGGTEGLECFVHEFFGCENSGGVPDCLFLVRRGGHYMQEEKTSLQVMIRRGR